MKSIRHPVADPRRRGHGDGNDSRRRSSGRPAERAERAEAANHRSTPEPRIYSRPIAPERIDADAIKVIRRLTRSGHKAYLVGGSVRDLLLGRKPKDFDIATSARPSEMRSLFRNCRVIGRRFRLAHILFGGGKIIEVATFRKDPNDFEDDVGAPPGEREDVWEDGGRGFATRPSPEDPDLLIRHDNVFGEPHEDAQRRDFTINGLFYDIDRSEVIDYVDGMPDLESGVVRTIRRPAIRLREDPVRILRAIKFSARLDLGIDPELYDAMVDQRQELERAAKPRVLEEIFRLLRGGASARSTHLMWDTGVLAVLLPELSAYLDDAAAAAGDSDALWSRLAAVDLRQTRGQLPSDAVLLAALLLGPLEEWLEGADDANNADNPRDLTAAFDDFFYDIGVRLVVPKRIKDRMRSIVATQARLREGRGAYLARRDFYEDAVALFAIDGGVQGPPSTPPVREPHLDFDDSIPGRRRRRRRPRR